MNDSDFSQVKRKKRLLLTAVVVIVLLILGFSVFFRITTISVEGEYGTYSEQEILLASGLKTGRLIFFIKPDLTSEKIETAFPTLSSVSVMRVLPSTVLIIADESSVRVSVTLNGEEWIMDENGHILSLTGADADYPRVIGLSSSHVSPGAEPETEGADTYRLDFIKGILLRLKKENLIHDLTEINTENIAELYFVMDEKYTVKLGSSDKLEYKLSRFLSIYNDLSAPGTIDVSEEGKSYFIPD